jgi:hypothetical protein
MPRWPLADVDLWRLEALPEAGAERAVVDRAADLEQQVGTTPGGHAKLWGAEAVGPRPSPTGTRVGQRRSLWLNVTTPRFCMLSQTIGLQPADKKAEAGE